MGKSALAVSSLVVAAMILGVARGVPRSRLLAMPAVVMGDMEKNDPAATATAITVGSRRAPVIAGGQMMRADLGIRAVGLPAAMRDVMRAVPRPGVLVGIGRTAGGRISTIGEARGKTARASLYS